MTTTTTQKMMPTTYEDCRAEVERLLIHRREAGPVERERIDERVAEVRKLQEELGRERAETRRAEREARKKERARRRRARALAEVKARLGAFPAPVDEGGGDAVGALSDKSGVALLDSLDAMHALARAVRAAPLPTFAIASCYADAGPREYSQRDFLRARVIEHSTPYASEGNWGEVHHRHEIAPAQSVDLRIGTAGFRLCGVDRETAVYLLAELERAAPRTWAGSLEQVERYGGADFVGDNGRGRFVLIVDGIVGMAEIPPEPPTKDELEQMGLGHLGDSTTHLIEQLEVESE